MRMPVWLLSSRLMAFQVHPPSSLQPKPKTDGKRSSCEPACAQGPFELWQTALVMPAKLVVPQMKKVEMWGCVI